LSCTVEDAKGAPLPNVLVNAEMQTAAGTLSQSAIEIAEDSASNTEERFLLKHVPAGRDPRPGL
jgi:hypothetical protein